MSKTTNSIIKTAYGDFKLRKNGRVRIILSPDTENEEHVRVTPISGTLTGAWKEIDV